MIHLSVRHVYPQKLGVHPSVRHVYRQKRPLHMSGRRVYRQIRRVHMSGRRVYHGFVVFVVLYRFSEMWSTMLYCFRNVFSNCVKLYHTPTSRLVHSRRCAPCVAGIFCLRTGAARPRGRGAESAWTSPQPRSRDTRPAGRCEGVLRKTCWLAL